MRKQLVRALTVVVLGSAAGLAGPSGPASAAPPERESFTDTFRVVEQNFCETSGLAVLVEGTATGRFQGNARGKSRLSYYMEHVRVERTITNRSSGDYVTEVQNVTDKDLRVTDNGDGTLTILVLATGNATVYDSAGKAIARNPGQTRFEILVDNAGTPTDASDDTFIEFLGIVKESTGRTDDFCSAVVAAIT